MYLCKIKRWKIFLIIFTLICLISVFVFARFSPAFSDENNTYPEHIPGELIACVQTGVHNPNANISSSDVAASNNQMNDFLNSYNCKTLLCATSHDDTFNQLCGDSSFITIKNQSIQNEIPIQLRFVKISFDESQKSMSQMIKEIQSNPNVKYAQPNYVNYCQANEPYDDYSSAQYAYDTIGSTGSHNKYGMNVEGWNDKSSPNVPTPQQPTVVAVIDTGVDYLHPDLKIANKDYGDLGKKIGVGGTYGFNASADDPASEQAKDPMDNVLSEHGHGTHVAGSIGALWNNQGISGGGFPLSILPVRTASDNGGFKDESVVRAYGYITQAAQKGINVKAVNNSWGGATNNTRLVSDLVTIAGQSGIISVFASGNSHKDCDINAFQVTYLQNNPYAIVVNSTNSNGDLANYSNWGFKTTDVCAPGDNIFSTAPSWTNGDDVNLMVSDTRFLKDSDYTKVDDFESTTKLEYYSDKECTQKLNVVGDISNPKGYNSNRALCLPKDSESNSIYIKGNFSQYKKDGNINLCLLCNADTLSSDSTNTIQCDIANAGDSGPINSVSFSPATLNYGAVSLPLSKIKLDSDGNGLLLIKVGYTDKNLSLQKSNFYIDDVCIAKKELPYRYMSGTSMASPACCGIAAVVSAQHPQESVTKIAARIKGGTTRLDKLSDKCYSGGIVNLTRSNTTAPDTELDPVVIDAKLDEQKMLCNTQPSYKNSTVANNNTIVKIKGYFLGKSSTIVEANGIKATDVIYSKESDLDVLTCTFPSKLSGSTQLVVNKSGKTLTRYYDLGDAENLLQRLPLPDKSDPQFSNFYNSLATYVVFANKKMLLINGLTTKNNYFVYNFGSQTWSCSDITERIDAKAKMQGLENVNNVTFFASNNDDLMFSLTELNSATSEEIMLGIASVNQSNGEISISKINEKPKGVKQLILYDRDNVYFALSNNGANIIYCFNLQSKECIEIANNINIGSVPTPYKISDGEYLLIDRAYSDLVPTMAFRADMYILSINNKQNGVSCQKLEHVAYPTSVADQGQYKAAGYVLDGTNLIMSGAANYDFNTHKVISDTFVRDLKTQTETSLSGILSTSVPQMVFSVSDGDNIYTSFKNEDGFNIAVRTLHNPAPPKPTPDPAPGHEQSKIDPTPAAKTEDPIARVVWMIFNR